VEAVDSAVAVVGNAIAFKCSIQFYRRPAIVDGRSSDVTCTT
jgi:hypothetical protein